MEQSYRPDKDLRDATIIISSTTTSDGAAGGTTLVDTVLTQGNDYWNNMSVVILSGNSIGQIRRISDFDAATDTVTVDTTFASQIVSGTKYNIITQYSSSSGAGTATIANQTLMLADVGDASVSTLGSLYGITGNPSASIATTLLDGIDARANNPTLNALLGVTDAAGRSINGNIGDFQAQTNLQTLLASLGIPDVAGKDLYTCLITDRLDNATYGLSALETLVDDLESRLTSTRAGYLDNLASTALGRTNIIEVSITSAANAGAVTLTTVTTQPCLIKSIVIHADTASQTDLTSCAVTGGASNVITFINATDAAVANLNAVDEQVAWTGAVRLAATKTIVMTLVGTGITAVDLTVTIEYEACVAGGYLV